uniref:Uncharacterized protein n=1 Tax=Anguilla anguilla TaxID=7936 RepID=A0A0E9PXD7_ANGAN
MMRSGKTRVQDTIRVFTSAAVFEFSSTG